MRTETPVNILLSDYRPFPFEVDTVSLNFSLEPENTLVEATLRVRKKDPNSDSPLILNGEGLSLQSISIDDTAIPTSAYELSDTELRLPTVPDAFTLKTRVLINPKANSALSGLYISGDRFCTQCEATGFRRITYWPDRPDVMSRFTVRLEADKAAYPILLSNGTPGHIGDLNSGRHFAEWDDPHPKPSYLFALCAGDYDIHTDTFKTMNGDQIELAIHVDKGDASRAKWAMESLKASMRWDEEVFGRAYDLGVFNIVAVRDFNFGAMENKGLNIFNSAYVLADESTATDADFEAIESIVAHEYFHNWTGNRITCRDWFQLCLKEGLTVFRDQEFSADMRDRAVQRIKDVIRLRARQFPEDAGPLAHAVRPDHYASIDNLYTATVYEKGAELIRMLKTLIGDTAFAKGMETYFDRHDGEATTIEHFYTCFEEASGQALSNFRSWYSQPGTPTVAATEDWDEKTGEFKLTLAQSNPKSAGHDRPKPLPIPLVFSALDREGNVLTEGQIELLGAKTEWRLNASSGRPLLSLNRGFSAPIKLVHSIDDDTRLEIAKLDTDPFNTWDIFQTLLKRELLALAYDGKKSPDDKLINALADTIRRSRETPAFAALLARLPSMGDVFLDRSPADPAALEDAQAQMQTALAMALEADIFSVLSAPSPAPFNPGAEQAGIRALRGAMVTLLSSQSDEGSAETLESLFRTAPNMTEKMSALRALCRRRTPFAADAISDFETTWSKNELVIDKWFGVQAATANAKDLKELLQHDRFSLDNPNRVRSVLGVFGAQNLANFHAVDGSGYRVVSSLIPAIDKRNPALAARLLTVFEQWTAVAPDIGAHAKAALEELTTHDLSKNAADIIKRTLA